MLPPETLYKYAIEQYFVIDTIAKCEPGGNQEIESAEVWIPSVNLGYKRYVNQSLHKEHNKAC